MEQKYKCNYYAAMHYFGWAGYTLIAHFPYEDNLQPYNKDLSNEWQNEIHQYFITNLNDDDCKYLTEHFTDLIYAYCPELDVNICCIDNSGTNRSYVRVYTDLPDAECEYGKLTTNESVYHYTQAQGSLEERFTKIYGYVTCHSSENYYKGCLITLEDIVFAIQNSVSKSTMTQWAKYRTKVKNVSLSHYIYYILKK